MMEGGGRRGAPSAGPGLAQPMGGACSEDFPPLGPPRLPLHPQVGARAAMEHPHLARIPPSHAAPRAPVLCLIGRAAAIGSPDLVVGGLGSTEARGGRLRSG